MPVIIQSGNNRPPGAIESNKEEELGSMEPLTKLGEKKTKMFSLIRSFYPILST
jgi:hypothetical protein